MALAILCALVLGGGASFAQSYDPDQTIPKATLLEKRIEKLGRGVTNILFGWTEIPLTIDRKIKQGKPLTYLLGTAPILGTTRAFVRTGVGIFEVVTFRRSKKSVNYEPILEPDYLF